MPQPADRFEPDLLRIETTHRDGTVTLEVAGELDISTRDLLWSHVDAAVASRPDSITLEASGLVFLDSTGPTRARLGSTGDRCPKLGVA